MELQRLSTLSAKDDDFVRFKNSLIYETVTDWRGRALRKEEIEEMGHWEICLH
jgi:hypothetical protein